MSDRQYEAIAKLLAPAARRASASKDLDDWDLTLTCDHVLRVHAHRTDTSYPAQVVDCPKCDSRRGVVTQEHLGPSADHDGQIKRERLTAEIQTAKEKLHRQQRAVQKSEKIIHDLSAQLETNTDP